MREKKMTNEEIVKDIERSTGMPSYWKTIVLDLINRQQSEIERLREELATAKQELVNEQRYYENAYSKTCQLETQNAELQKQVDELAEERDVFKRLFESANTSNFSTNSIIETMNSFYREQAEHLAGLKIEQSVKDTATEIYRELIEMEENPCNSREEIYQAVFGKRGVEVE